jgi:N-acetylneuraminic acid mutarotase
MPTARAGTGCGVIDNTLYVAGGEGNTAATSGVFAQVEGYTPASDTWQSLADMPEPRHGVGGATWDGALYLCGGASRAGFGAIASTAIFRP